MSPKSVKYGHLLIKVGNEVCGAIFKRKRCYANVNLNNVLIKPSLHNIYNNNCNYYNYSTKQHVSASFDLQNSGVSQGTFSGFYLWDPMVYSSTVNLFWIAGTV